MKYTVVRTRKLNELIEQVNLLIQEGWKPQGGICESTYQGSAEYYQAMIKNSAVVDVSEN